MSTARIGVAMKASSKGMPVLDRINMCGTDRKFRLTKTTPRNVSAADIGRADGFGFDSAK